MCSVSLIILITLIIVAISGRVAIPSSDHFACCAAAFGARSSNRLAQHARARMFVTPFPSRSSFVPKRYLISTALYPVALVSYSLPFFIMPPQSSTLRRRCLADFLDRFGEAAIKKCSTCAKHSRVYKVYIRSGKCNECVRRG